jgi:hypothetical protein
MKTLELSEIEESALRTALEEAHDELRDYLLGETDDLAAKAEFEAVRGMYQRLFGQDLGSL